MSQQFNNILVIQTAFIGDVVLATGVIVKLKAFFPEATIDILVKKENRSILTGQPFIHETLLFDKRRKFKEILRLAYKIRSKKYDLVVNLHRFASSGILTALSGSGMKVGFKKNPFSFLYTQSFEHSIGNLQAPQHEIERNNALIAGFTDAVASKPHLELLKSDMAQTIKYDRQPYICIAPASIWHTKELPENKWVELIKLIPDAYTIYILGAKSDTSLAERIKNNSRRNNVKVLAGEISLTQSAALMKTAVLSFVNDSAPLHLASAVNAPVCAVFCSTIPEFGFGPLSDFSRIVQIDYALECRPCNLHGYKHCPQEHFKCGKDIQVEKLFAVFKEAEERMLKTRRI